MTNFLAHTSAMVKGKRLQQSNLESEIDHHHRMLRRGSPMSWQARRLVGSLVKAGGTTLTNHQYRVAFAAADRANKDGEVYMSLDSWAERADSDRRLTVRCVTQLVEMGVLRRGAPPSAGRRSQTYWFVGLAGGSAGQSSWDDESVPEIRAMARDFVFTLVGPLMRLEARAFRVAMVLVDHLNADGRVCESIATLARAADLTNSSLLKGIEDLESKGAVACDRSSGGRSRSSSYRFLIPAEAANSVATPLVGDKDDGGLTPLVNPLKTVPWCHQNSVATPRKQCRGATKTVSPRHPNLLEPKREPTLNQSASLREAEDADLSLEKPGNKKNGDEWMSFDFVGKPYVRPTLSAHHSEALAAEEAKFADRWELSDRPVDRAQPPAATVAPPVAADDVNRSCSSAPLDLPGAVTEAPNTIKRRPRLWLGKPAEEKPLTVAEQLAALLPEPPARQPYSATLAEQLASAERNLQFMREHAPGATAAIKATEDGITALRGDYGGGNWIDPGIEYEHLGAA
jgi:hypothetical protein